MRPAPLRCGIQNQAKRAIGDSPHTVASASTLSASRTRSSPEMSLGSSVSRRAIRVSDSAAVACCFSKSEKTPLIESP